MPRPNNSSSSSSNWEEPISDSQAIELSNYLLTTEEEQEFLATQEGSQTTDQDVTQESEEAPLSWETHGYMGRDYTQTGNWHWDGISNTWYYGPQFPYATQADNDPVLHSEQDSGWEEWLAAVTASPPQDFYYLEQI